MGAGSSVIRMAGSAKPVAPRLECELAVTPPRLPGEGDGDSCLVCASASNADPKPKLGDVLSLISSLLVDHELRAAALLVNDLASSSLGSVETTGTRSALKAHVAQFLDTHAGAVSNDLSMSIKYGIGNDTNDDGVPSSWPRATSGDIEWASSSLPTPPRKGNDATHLVDSSAEPNLQFGDVLELLAIPLDDSELRAASLLVDGLVASTFGEVELSCTNSALKNQIAQMLDANRGALSNVVFAFISRHIGADANLATQERGSPASVAGPGLRPSFSISLMSSPSSEVLGEMTSEDFAGRPVTPTPDWMHHEYIDVSDSEHTAFTESDGSFDDENADETRTPTSASSCLDDDEDSESE